MRSDVAAIKEIVAEIDELVGYKSGLVAWAHIAALLILHARQSRDEAAALGMMLEAMPQLSADPLKLENEALQKKCAQLEVENTAFRMQLFGKREAQS